MAGVKLVNVTKTYNDKPVIKDLSIEVKDKEFFIIAGPPGTGKTTILRIIAGLERVDAGEIYIDDQLVNDIDTKDRDIAMIFENLALYPNKTAFENIAFSLRRLRTSEAEIRSKVLEVAKMLMIEHLLGRKPATFSGGERQRVAIARAIIRRPRVYLMDQPLANLDAKIRESMRFELKRLAEELGQTIIFTTHDQVEAVSMGERIAVMGNGRLQQYGSPSEVFSHPRNRFVANFIGSPSMNFLDCSYEERNGRAFLVHEAFKLDVTPLKHLISENSTSTELTLGIRPQHVYVNEGKPSERAFKATVYVAEPLGTESILSLQVGSNLIKAVVPMMSKTEMGEEKYIEFDMDNLHVFDRKTEWSIV